MTTRKRRESVQRLIVVLEGEKVTAADKTGIVPLEKASTYMSNNTEDEILVLTLLSVDCSGPSSSKGFRGDHRCNHTCEDDPRVRFLRDQVSQKKEDYRRILRPFYERCKSNGVKFMVKVAAGYQPNDIITEEANNVGATWIVIDSCFTKHLTFRLSGTECNVSLVSDEDRAFVDDHWIAEDESSECSTLMEVIHNPKSPKLIKGSTSKEKLVIWPSTGKEMKPEPLKGNEAGHNLPCSNFSSRVSAADFTVKRPQELSWEEITQITKRFSTRTRNEHEKNYSTYIGYFDHQSVFVKWFVPHSGCILEAEMKAALFMNHKNITVITGFHQSENGTILIFPLLQGMSLDRYIWGSERKKLKFQARLNIAIAIAQGVRYMHEECPQWPVVHGDLQPQNIFLRLDLQPMISGFGKATWLHNEQLSFNSKNGFLKDPLGHETTELVKCDVLSFGILLLRLFCRTSAPEDDKSLVEWARPLMLQRKFYELLEEDSEWSDLHGIYRVMTAATACTRTKPVSRPYMCQVISILKGENFCYMQTSPSDSSI
ncbi:hypothetical protein ES288_A12G148800v1 [Gossypium darwinii]|uniref:Protein kinase domain-containing protein n=1 Tax=Gossypium darwinii TaxID=34276 RepID=A0A5D2E9S9_GOSDA|nr:hypothetical protein ES288_A12G148800v1 [Gossypium darwinii]